MLRPSSTPPDSPAADGNWLLYDGECPFCARYVHYVRLQHAVGPVILADARTHPDLVAQARQRGLRIDDGMVLKLDGRFYHGAECLHALALLTTSSDTFNRCNRLLFRSRAVSRLAYPLLRAGRNLTLKILGRSRLPA